MIVWSCGVRKDKAPGKYTDFERGNAYNNNGRLDSALFMYNRYISNADDTLKKGAAYRYIGDILWEAGDLYGAEESATGAIRTLDPFNKAHDTELCYTYRLLGNINFDLQHYDEAVNMYNRAMDFSTNADFPLEVMSDKAVAFQKKGAYNKAIAVYDSIILLNPADRSLVARIIDNRARTKWLEGSDSTVLPGFWSALQIRTDSQYNRGLIASYAHLADYYTKPDPDSALWYTRKMFQQAQTMQSPTDRLEATDKLIRLDNSSTTKGWYNEYKKLDDSLQLSKDTTRSRDALIRYDSQKSKAENFELREHNTRQRLLLYGLIIVATLVIALLWSWYNKRRKRIKLEADKEIQQSKLRTSQKVHDVVANGLYVIMNELEHGKTIEKEALIARIEGLYEKSRNISYEDNAAGSNGEYDKQISQLLTSFASEQTKVVIAGNGPAFWKRISDHPKQELQLVLKELMVNMKKHSQANNVVVVFKQENNKGLISYTDDGIGFKPDHQFGNGLNNTVNRIKSLHGEVIFGKSEKDGASITISFPLQSGKT